MDTDKNAHTKSTASTKRKGGNSKPPLLMRGDKMFM